MPTINTEEEKTTATTAATEKFGYSTCVLSLCFISFHISFSFSRMKISFLNNTTEKSLVFLIIIIIIIYIINASATSRKNNRTLEFPFASLERARIVFNSINVDLPINPSRTTKELRLVEEKKISSSDSSDSSLCEAKIHARITAIDARSLRSAVVGLIDSIALVVETVERCER